MKDGLDQSSQLAASNTGQEYFKVFLDSSLMGDQITHPCNGSPRVLQELFTANGLYSKRSVKCSQTERLKVVARQDRATQHKESPLNSYLNCLELTAP